MSDFTTKQRAFITAYLGEAKFNALEAARIAGYSHPRSASEDNMKPGYKVREEIERRLKEQIPSESELLAEMADLATAKHGDEWVRASDKRQALKDLLEIAGKVIQRHEVEVNSADEMRSLLGLTSKEETD